MKSTEHRLKSSTKGKQLRKEPLMPSSLGYHLDESLLTNCNIINWTKRFLKLYTLPQKKCHFFEVAFLLGTSVGQWILGQISFVHCSQEHFPWCTWPEVTDPGQGSPWKIWKLKLRFFWGRTLSKTKKTVLYQIPSRVTEPLPSIMEKKENHHCPLTFKIQVIRHQFWSSKHLDNLNKIHYHFLLNLYQSFVRLCSLSFPNATWSQNGSNIMTRSLAVLCKGYLGPHTSRHLAFYYFQ